MPKARSSNRRVAHKPDLSGPPNCIRVTAHDVSGMVAVGPGILFENDDFKQVEFHPAFRRRLCGSPQMIKIAIAQCKRQLGIEKVVNA